MQALRVLLLCLGAFVCGVVQAGESAVASQRSDSEAFAEARREQRSMLLHLKAVWCHWCHVMDRETYRDKTVLAAIDAKYVPLRIDRLAIRKYIDAFLNSPDGGYFVSHDADLKPGEHSADYFALDDDARRTRGMPRIDRSRYAREAGAISEALADLSEVTGVASALTNARTALAWAPITRPEEVRTFVDDIAAKRP